MRFRLVVLQLSLVAPALGAQTVTGRVVDAERGAPAVGAVVSLLADDGRRLAPALIGEDGAYRIIAPNAGSYRVRVDLIGYEAWQSDPLALGVRDSVGVDVKLPLRRTTLSAVTVQDRSRCDARPQDAARVVGLWEEVRRALTISDISARRQLVPLDITLQERDLVFGRATPMPGPVGDSRVVPGSEGMDRSKVPARQAVPNAPPSPSGSGGGGFPRLPPPPSPPTATGVDRSGRTFRATRERLRGGGVRPWSTPPASELAERGYVQRDGEGLLFYAPDIAVLLDESFFATHCFRPVKKGDDVGLAFAPLPDRSLGDIEGTVWLDANTSELRTVNFTFVNVPGMPSKDPSGVAPAGGRLEFARLGAAWYVRHWELRQMVGLSMARLAAMARERIGDAVPVTASRLTIPATVRGLVIDSTVGDALAGATVHLPGATPVVTDSLGRFAITVSDAPADSLDFVLTVEHPRFDALSLANVEQTVRLWPGASSALTVATPSVATLVAALCPRDDASSDTGMILGHATTAAGAPLPAGTRVVAEWTSDEKLGAGAASRTRQVTVPVGADGRFRVCPVPNGKSFALYLESAPGSRTEVALTAMGLAEVELVKEDR